MTTGTTPAALGETTKMAPDSNPTKTKSAPRYPTWSEFGHAFQGTILNRQASVVWHCDHQHSRPELAKACASRELRRG